MTDKIKTSLKSKIFLNENNFIFVNRTYASKNKPQPNKDNLKLIKVFDKPDDWMLEGRPAFCGTYGDKKCDLDAYENTFFYRPLYDAKNIKKIQKNIGYDVFDKALWKIRLDTDFEKFKILDKNKSPIKEVDFEAHAADKDKREKALKEKYKKEISEFEQIEESLKGSYLINDEFKVPLTPENLDKYIKINKQNLNLLTEDLIADWYSLDVTYQWNADTAQKKETAILKRRIDITKNLPSNKKINHLINKDIEKNIKRKIKDREYKRAKDLSKYDQTILKELIEIFQMPKTYFYIIGALLVAYIVYSIETYEPKKINCGNPQSDFEKKACEKAFERTYEEKWGRKPGKIPN